MINFKNYMEVTLHTSSYLKMDYSTGLHTFNRLGVYLHKRYVLSRFHIVWLLVYYRPMCVHV